MPQNRIVFPVRKDYIFSMKRFSTLAALCVGLALTACTPVVATRGNLISDVKFEAVQAKASKRADVVSAWGPPTVQSSFDPGTWYYIGETTSQRGIYAPEVTKRRIVRVKFDSKDNDTVAAIDDIDPALAKDIALVDRTTPSAGREYTFLQQMIGNIGKYNVDTTQKK